jgi:hypothetical protein
MNLPFVATPGWWVGAKCRLDRVPLSRFFTKEHAQSSKKICRECLVRYQCLSAHIDEPFGVWGGHPRDERNKVMYLIEQGSTLKDASRSIDSRRKG